MFNLENFTPIQNIFEVIVIQNSTDRNREDKTTVKNLSVRMNRAKIWQWSSDQISSDDEQSIKTKDEIYCGRNLL